MRKFTNDDYANLLKILPITHIDIIGPEDNFTFVPVKVTDYKFANYTLTYTYGPSVPYEQIDICNREKLIDDKYYSPNEQSLPSNKLVRDMYSAVSIEAKNIIEHNSVVALYEQFKDKFPLEMPINKRIDAIKELNQILNKHIAPYKSK